MFAGIRYNFNVKNSPDWYLRFNYSTEEIVNGILDRGELERDMEAIKDAVSQSEGIIF